MEKLDPSKFLKLSLLALFVLFFTPFSSSWTKPPILFLLLNLLILALGAESGVFTNSPRRTHDERPTPTTILVSHHNDGVIGAAHNDGGGGGGSCNAKLLVEKPVTTETVVKVVTMNLKVKKSPSTPSLFFIDERIGRKEEEEEEENETINGADELGAQELFVKAEGFIGNFYKQLKMQREESWRKIHGLYQRPV